MNNNELTHHGILGMKWGVRRFQNKDGSYTNRGKERYKKPSKNPREMSNEELDRVLARKRKEAEYRKLKNNENPARKFMEVFKNVAITTLATSAAIYAIKKGKKFINKNIFKNPLKLKALASETQTAFNVLDYSDKFKKIIPEIIKS